MQEQLEAVTQFQKAFGQNVSEAPTLISKEKAELRYKLGLEELDE